MSTSDFDDTPLTHAEELDSDQIRNDDGDETVDPPERWIPVKDDENLEQRLAEEEPDVIPDGGPDQPPTEAHDAEQGGALGVGGDVDADSVLDRIEADRLGVDRGQIDGTPEDGESFFTVVE